MFVSFECKDNFVLYITRQCSINDAVNFIQSILQPNIYFNL